METVAKMFKKLWAGKAGSGRRYGVSQKTFGLVWGPVVGETKIPILDGKGGDSRRLDGPRRSGEEQKHRQQIKKTVRVICGLVLMGAMGEGIWLPYWGMVLEAGGGGAINGAGDKNRTPGKKRNKNYIGTLKGAGEKSTRPHWGKK